MHKPLFKVIDKTYLPDENQDVFFGTFLECQEFWKSQDYHFAYEVVTNITENIHDDISFAWEDLTEEEKDDIRPSNKPGMLDDIKTI